MKKENGLAILNWRMGSGEGLPYRFKFPGKDDMKIENITDVDSFFKVIDQCKGPVELVSPEGDRINLKSKLSQYLSMASMFSNGYIKELDIVARDKEDVERLIKYMYQGE